MTTREQARAALEALLEMTDKAPEGDAVFPGLRSVCPTQNNVFRVALRALVTALVQVNPDTSRRHTKAQRLEAIRLAIRSLDGGTR